MTWSLHPHTQTLSTLSNLPQRLVCLGWTADALSLLGLHSAWAAWKSGGSLHPALAGRIRSLDAVASLLRCFPRLAGSGAAAGSPRRGAADSGAGQELSGAEEFLSYRARWQGQSALVLGEGSLWEGEHEAPCRALLACMAGDVEQSSRLATSWPELLVARLLAGHPAVGHAADLLHLVRAAAAARPPPAAGLGDAAAALSARALALLTACAGLDAQAALQACSHGASAWLSAHAALVVAQHPAGEGYLGAGGTWALCGGRWVAGAPRGMLHESLPWPGRALGSKLPHAA